MNRSRTIIAAAVVLIVAVGLLLLWQSMQPEPSPPKPTTAADQPVPAEKPAEPVAEGQAKPEEPATAETSSAAREEPKPAEPAASPEPAQPAQPTQQAARATPPETATTAPAPVAELVPPDFDVVRVETNGEAVLAGRAMAGSEVSVLDGGAPLGKVDADGRGQWVFVVEPPLAPGSHELSLESRLADGRMVASANVVVVNVPMPQVAAAPQPSPQQPTAQTATTATPAAPSAATTPAAPVEAARATAGGGPKLAPEASTEEKPLAVLMPRTGQGPSQVLQQSVSPQEGLAEGTLVLESIDYDEKGAIIGGRAEPGTRLIVYLDDAALGETVAAADGRWSLRLDRPLATGLHRLRVDAVDAAGKVLARVETPFSRAALAEALPDETSVVVQPGNSLWRIARRVYGEGIRYSLIFEANRGQIRDADLIYPGQIFKVPMSTPAAAPAN